MPRPVVPIAFTPRAAAREVEKVLRSAVANAESNPNLRWNGDDLFISAVFVDEGPTLKRWRLPMAPTMAWQLRSGLAISRVHIILLKNFALARFG